MENSDSQFPQNNNTTSDPAQDKIVNPQTTAQAPSGMFSSQPQTPSVNTPAGPGVSMLQSQPKIEMPQGQQPTKKKFGIGKILLLVFVLLIVLFFAGGAYALYGGGDIPFLTTAQKTKVARMAMQLPLLPKTDDLILGAALSTEQKTDSLTFDGKVDVTLTTGGVATTYPVNYVGAYENTGTSDAPDADMSIAVDMNSGAQAMSFEVRKVGTVLYVQIPDSLMAPGALGATWYSLSLDALEAMTGPMTSEESSDKSLIEQNEYLYEDYQLADHTERLENAQISGVDSYHVRISPPKEAWNEIIKRGYESSGSLSSNPLLPLSSMPDISLTGTVDVYFAVDTLFIMQLDLDLNVQASLPSYSMDTQNSVLPSGVLGALDEAVNMKFKFNYRTKTYNEPVTIEEPLDAVPLETLLQGLLGGFTGMDASYGSPELDIPSDVNPFELPDLDIPDLSY